MDSGPEVVELRILGTLEVVRATARVEPTSAKQRALLLDLLIHRGESVRRDRLIDDLWGEDPPSTAANLIQTYVSALRRALGADLIRTVGTGYALATESATVDAEVATAHVAAARAALGAGDLTTTEHHATAALELWRGETLADVAFEQFARAAIAELDTLRGEAIELLAEALLRLDRASSALPQLEAAVERHPTRERLWWMLLLAQYRGGRQADSLRSFRRARTALVEELGVEPSAELRGLEAAILAQDPMLDSLWRGAATAAGPTRVDARPTPATPIVGRAAERAAMEAHLEEQWSATGERRLLVLCGEPGIGKTRLLQEAADLGARRGLVLAGRCYEAELCLPYGAWIDALRSIEVDGMADDLARDLAPLLPRLSADDSEIDRASRLHDGVRSLLATRAAAGPVTVVIDDLQWLDESSVALLHFVARRLGPVPVAVIAAARSAELEANAQGRRMLDALRRDDLVTLVGVGPMEAATLSTLAGAIAPGADLDMIARESGGNPLLAIEMARAIAGGDDAPSGRLDALIDERLSRLEDVASALVPWVAAFGRGVDPMTLSRLMDQPLGSLFEPLGALERHGVLRADTDGRYDFCHDLVRTVAYQRLSIPRRRLLHARIGNDLATGDDPDDLASGEAARHADLGGDGATCAAACVRAARRCIRLGAHDEARRHVELGRRRARDLSTARRVAVDLDLIHVLLHPALNLREPGTLGAELSALCADAQRAGLQAELSTGLMLLARLHHWAFGDIPQATALAVRALKVMEAATDPTAEPILEGARCLAYLEIEMERTARLFTELASLDHLATESQQYQWGLGLVRRWQGDVAGARTALIRAVELAEQKADHWAAFECTARLALMELDEGDTDAGTRLAGTLTDLAGRLGDGGSEPAFAAGIVALASCHTGGDDGGRALDLAIAELDRIGARFLLPDLLVVDAGACHRRGDLAAAYATAERAEAIATQVGRAQDAARSGALLAHVATALGRFEEAKAHRDRVLANHHGALPGQAAVALAAAESAMMRGTGQRG